MKKISLDVVIEEQKNKDAKFKKEYLKQLFLNKIAKLIADIRPQKG